MATKKNGKGSSKYFIGQPQVQELEQPGGKETVTMHLRPIMFTAMIGANPILAAVAYGDNAKEATGRALVMCGALTGIAPA